MLYSNYGFISCCFCDSSIQCQKISRLWNPSQEPIKVVESGTIRQKYGFVLVFYSNFVHETDIWGIWLQNAVTLKTGLGSVIVIENVTIR